MDSNSKPDRAEAHPGSSRGRDTSADADENQNASSSASRGAVPTEQDASTPQPPSPLETEFYYGGFPTEPRLVARTSLTPWKLQSATKAMANVGTEHPLVALWPRVIDELVAALTPLDWAAMDLLRVGYSGTNDRTWPVTLMVAVAPGTPWERAYPVAVACRAVLRYHGIRDVECEVRESSYLFTTKDAGNKVNRLHTAAETAKLPAEERYFSELIGQPISPCQTPNLQGSLGLYLQVGTSREVHALTCRHVLLGVEEKPAAQVSKQLGSEYLGHGVDQPGQTTFELLEKRASRRSPTRNAHSTVNVTDTPSRTIGFLRYAPPRTVDQNKWLHDWALVRLSGARYADPAGLQNWIAVDEYGYDCMLECLAPGNKTKKPQKQAGGNLVRLQGFVSLREILRKTATATATATANENKDLWVHCVGHSGSDRPQMTTGLCNEVCSVRRMPCPQVGSDAIVTTRELCVVGRNSVNQRTILRHGGDSSSHTGKLLPFSVAGDSGSAVFDSQGRVVGIVTGGIGRQEDLAQTNNCSGYGDVSYVTPIEVILDAVRAKYGWVAIP